LQPASTAQKKQSLWLNKLYEKQRGAFDFIVSRPATALFCTPGTGKTYISLAVLEQTDWRVALIVAPFTSLGITWLPKITLLPLTEVHGGLEELRGSLKSPGRHPYRHIVLTNPEALRRDLKRIDRLPWDLVIWDESQNIKNRSSINSRLARRLRHVPRRLALSGTPLDTGQIDIWAQMRFVDHMVFGEDWRDFANEYCYKTGWMGKEWKFSERKHPQFLRALRQHIFRLDDKFLGLKPLQLIPVPVILLGNQRQIYETMERDSIVEFDGGMVRAHNEGARDVKLSQITGGAMLDEEGQAHPTGRAKARKLAHLLRRDDWPVVIFCQYLHEIDIILELFAHEPYTVRVISGGVKSKERTRIISDFQAGKINALICQIKTGGESIDLTRASTLIMYSMTYSYINFEQTIRRLQRGGQENQVRAYILYCVDTIDMDKLQLVKQKSKTSFRILTPFEE
jgi:SNF2 family DNA or RNA helicase